MAKRSGLGGKLFMGGFDLGIDVQSWATSGGPTLLDVTSIEKSAMERIGGRRDGKIDLVAMFDDAAGASHEVLSALSTSDQAIILAIGTTLGDPAAFILGKQIDYPLARDADGKLTAAISVPSSNLGLFWGDMLTAGLRTESAATNGTSLDGTASSSFGLTAALVVTALASGSPTIKLQDSADNSSFADITGATFGVVAEGTNTIIQTATGATVRRYVRAVTTGTFSGLSFALAFARHPTSTI